MHPVTPRKKASDAFCRVAGAFARPARLLLALTLAVCAARAARAADTEWWVLAAQLDSGDRVLVEFTLTNLGPGERNAAAIGRWIERGGAVTAFSRAKLEGDWTPSVDGSRIDLGKFVFDRARSPAVLRVEKGSLRIALEFALAGAPLASRSFAGGKWKQELWVASAPVKTSLWKRGMAAPISSAGRLALSRRLISGSEAKLAQRRAELFTFGAAPIYLLEVARGARAERWLIACDANGKPIAQEAPVVAVAESLGTVSPRFVLAGPGMHGELRAGARLASYDPLADVPGLIKLALGLRLQSTWTVAPFSLRAGGRDLSGSAIASYTFYK
jgi:hypothetical protein